MNLLISDGNVPQAQLRNRHKSLCWCLCVLPRYTNKQRKHGDEVSAMCAPYGVVSGAVLNIFTNQNDKSEVCCE